LQAANIKGLLSTTASAGTPYDVDAQGASIYVHGMPAPDDPTVRQLERDTAAMSADNPYSGVNDERIAKYQAGAVEQRILHMQTNDPLRMPTYTIFPVPDYFFGTSGPNVAINPAFAYDHGYYSPNIDVPDRIQRPMYTRRWCRHGASMRSRSKAAFGRLPRPKGDWVTMKTGEVPLPDSPIGGLSGVAAARHVRSPEVNHQDPRHLQAAQRQSLQPQHWQLTHWQ